VRVNPWFLPIFLVAFAVIIFLVRDVADTLALVLAGLSALLALTGAAQSVINGLRPVTASFYIFWFAWLGVGPIAQLTLGEVAWGDTTVLADRGRVWSALGVSVVAILMFWIGDRFCRARDRRAQSVAGSASVRRVLVLILVISLAIVGYVAVRGLGFSTFFASRIERGSAVEQAGVSIEQVGGAKYALYSVLPPALAVTVALLSVFQLQRIWRAKRRLSVVYAVTLLGGVAGMIVFANPLSATRFITLTAFGSLALALLRPRSVRSGFVFLALGICGTLLIYPLANVFRYENSSIGEVTKQTFVSPDFDGFQQVVNSIGYIEAHGYSWGHQILSALLFFVPRSAWDGKAETASVEVAEWAGYSFTNLSLPVHAELNLQFGLPGVVIGMLALGYIASKIDNAWQTAPFASMAMFGVLRGPLGAQVSAYLPALIILIVSIRSSSGDARDEQNDVRDSEAVGQGPPEP